MPIYKVEGKKKDGLQKYQVKINFTDEYGKRRQIMRTAYGAQAAKELEQELMQKTKDAPEELQKTPAFTIQNLYDEYVNYISHEIRASSLNTKKKMFTNHILPFLKDVEVANIDVKTLQEWKMYVYGKGLALQTMKNAYTELRAMMNYRLRIGYIKKNLLVVVGDFKNAYEGKKEMSFYTPEEFQLYKNAALDRAMETGYYDYFIFFCLAYYTGARKGEIHALRWNKYDGKKISIETSISQKLQGQDIETPPKNKSSIREVQLPMPMVEILEYHKTRQQKMITDWNDSRFICGYYRPLRDTSIDSENRHIAKKAGLKRIRIHDFRHSHASVLINGNISPLEVAHRLGHATVEQTLKTYSHLFPSEAEKSLNILNSI